jgi:hypothetical protein
MGPFITDFCAEEYNLVIELDGGQHAGAVTYDKKRSAWLMAKATVSCASGIAMCSRILREYWRLFSLPCMREKNKRGHRA